MAKTTPKRKRRVAKPPSKTQKSTTGNTFSVPMMSGKILHVQVGLDGLWNPTKAELDAYLKMFAEVARVGGIVVTPRGVQVDLIDLQK